MLALGSSLRWLVHDPTTREATLLAKVLWRENTMSPADSTLAPRGTERFASAKIIAKMHLNELPEELLDDIFSRLDPPPEETDFDDSTRDDSSALAALSLVSKRFQRLASPRLYASTIRLHDQTQLRQLLRTLARRPDLACLVRRLDAARIPWAKVTLSGGRHVPCGPGPAACVDELLAAAREAAAPLAGDDGVFEADLRAGDERAEGVLLLLLCRNLRALSAVVHWDLEQSYLGRLLKAAAAAAPDHDGVATTTTTTTDSAHAAGTSARGRAGKPFAVLSYFCFTHGRDNRFSADFLRAALALPALRRLRADHIEHPLGRTEAAPWRRCLARSVERVELLDAGLCCADVLRLCRTCSALRSLTVRWGECDPDLQHVDQLREGLRLVRQTLEELVLDVRRTSWFVGDGTSEPGDALRPLRLADVGFERLRVLELSAVLLVGEKCASWRCLRREQGFYDALVVGLPRTLACLRVNHSAWAPEYFEPFLFALAESCGRGERARLRRVEVYPRTYGPWQVADKILDVLQPVFMRASVALVRPPPDYENIDDIYADDEG